MSEIYITVRYLVILEFICFTFDVIRYHFNNGFWMFLCNIPIADKLPLYLSINRVCNQSTITHVVYLNCIRNISFILSTSIWHNKNAFTFLLQTGYLYIFQAIVTKDGTDLWWHASLMYKMISICRMPYFIIVISQVSILLQVAL